MKYFYPLWQLAFLPTIVSRYIFAKSLKFIYSEKATKIWRNLQILFENPTLKKWGWFRKMCVALSQILNFEKYIHITESNKVFGIDVWANSQ